MDAPPLRWGILGTGWIAEHFVRSAQRHTRQRFTAVASRNAVRAKAFADRYGVPRSYRSYEELVALPDIDVVYVGTEHTAHLLCARLALEAGRHTLIEKPIGLNAAQATELIRLAAERGLFCAEALWTYFLPKFDIVRQILDSGVLGEIRTVLADIGQYFPADHRILRPELAGGPMLDLGTYPVSLATWVLGPPADVLAVGQPHPSGVNGQLAAILRDAAGNQAVLHTTVCSDTPTAAVIAGTRATLTLPGPFYQPGDVVLSAAGGGSPLTVTEPHTAHDALHFEVAETARRIASGDLEHSLWPLASSVTTLEVMDAIRAQCGITFPGEP
jgi:predicted dehydrogenase